MLTWIKNLFKKRVATREENIKWIESRPIFQYYSDPAESLLDGFEIVMGRPFNCFDNDDAYEFSRALVLASIEQFLKSFKKQFFRCFNTERIR